MADQNQRSFSVYTEIDALIEQATVEANAIMEKEAAARQSAPPPLVQAQLPSIKLAEQSIKLASTFDLLAQKGVTALVSKQAEVHAERQHSGSDNPDLQPPDNKTRSVEQTNNPLTVASSPVTVQKGTDTQPATDEKRDVDKRNDVGAVLKQAEGEEPEEEPEEEEAPEEPAEEEAPDPGAQALDQEVPDQSAMSMLGGGGMGGMPPAPMGDMGGGAVGGPEDAAMMGGGAPPMDPSQMGGGIDPMMAAQMGGGMPPGAGMPMGGGMPMDPMMDPELQQQADMMESYASAASLAEMHQKLAQDPVFRALAISYNKNAPQTPEGLAKVAGVKEKFAAWALALKDRQKTAMATGEDPTSASKNAPSSDSPKERAAGEGTPSNKVKIPFLESADAAIAFSKRQAEIASNDALLSRMFKAPVHDDATVHRHLPGKSL